MTDEERAALVERLRIEQAVRDELKPKAEEPKRKRWWESNLGLLLIGSLVSSLLVPWLQYTEKNFEWKRQNRFQNTNYRLERMRECLTEFILLWALNGEAYERARPLLRKEVVTQKDLDDFETQFVDLQNRRFRQNAKVVSLMIHFKSATALRDRFQEYIRGSSDFFRTVEATVRARVGNPNSPDGSDETLDSQLTGLGRVYEMLTNKMMEEIGMTEDANEKYRL
jgi:hypothetical protein